jgi:uncharacterized membrane protein
VSTLTCREDAHGPAGTRRRQPRDVERLFEMVGDLAKQELLQFQDVASAYRDDKGKVRIHQAIILTGTGAASGAEAGKLADVGINTIRQIASPRGGQGGAFPAVVTQSVLGRW